MDIIILVINMILAVISGIGAFKSIKYYKKNKELTIYAQTADIIEEVNGMLAILPQALEISTRKVKNQGRGTNYNTEIIGCGKKLVEHYQIIEKNIPMRYYDKLRRILKEGNFDFLKYINSYVSGSVLTNEGLDHNDFAKCQDRLVELQRFLREERERIEEKLK